MKPYCLSLTGRLFAASFLVLAARLSADDTKPAETDQVRVTRGKVIQVLPADHEVTLRVRKGQVLRLRVDDRTT